MQRQAWKPRQVLPALKLPMTRQVLQASRERLDQLLVTHPRHRQMNLPANRYLKASMAHPQRSQRMDLR
jgi:hypothetical protein